jgi:hypothetical protein
MEWDQNHNLHLKSSILDGRDLKFSFHRNECITIYAINEFMQEGKFEWLPG